jgi:hypothetical protein
MATALGERHRGVVEAIGDQGLGVGFEGVTDRRNPVTQRRPDETRRRGQVGGPM